MLRLLYLSLLVALASGSPRSRGEPLHRTIQARSGGDAVVYPNYQELFAPRQQTGDPVMVAVPIGNSQPQGATFQVDPNTLQATRIPGTVNVPVPLSDQRVPTPSQGATFQVDPNTLQVTRVVDQNRVQAPLAQTNVQNVFSSNPANPPVNNPFPSQPQLAVPQQQPNPITFNAGVPKPALNSIPNQQPIQHQGLSQNQLGNQQFGAFNRNDHLTRGTPVTREVELAKRLIGNPPGGAMLVGTNPPIFPIEKRLISNYTKLREVVTDTFRCSTDVVPNYVGYGYYGDVDNDCQIFHVCLPWKELYPKQFAQDVTYQFSFICPNQTVFSQDTMTCTWESEALPCEISPELYWMNQNFFRRVPGEFGTKYAEVNEKVVPPLVYDYDDFNPPKTSQG